MSITDPTKVQMAAPGNNIDQIIGILSGTISITAGGPAPGQTSASDTKITGFADSVLTKGLYSVDNGTTWYDLGDALLNGIDAVTGELYLFVSPVSYKDGTVVISANNFTRSAYTILYKVALIAKTNQGVLTPTATTPILSYTTKYNYMKVAFADALSVPYGSTTNVTHNLGYIPNFMIWAEYDKLASGDNLSLALWGNTDIVVDSTKLAITNTIGILANLPRIFHYRIYLDA